MDKNNTGFSNDHSHILSLFCSYKDSKQNETSKYFLKNIIFLSVVFKFSRALCGRMFKGFIVKYFAVFLQFQDIAQQEAQEQLLFL